MATAKKSIPEKDIHLSIPDKSDIKRAAQHIKISDPLLLPYEINVKKGTFNVVSPFTVKSGKSAGTNIDYIKYSGKRLSDSIAWIMQQKNSLPEGNKNKKEVLSLEQFLAKAELRSKEISALLLKFDQLFVERS